MMSKQKRNLLPYGLILAQCLFYGFGDPISKAAYETVQVGSLLTVRYAIAFAFLMLLGGKTIVRELKKGEWYSALVPSVCIALTYIISNFALKLSAATSVAFLRSLPNVMTPLLAFVVFRRRLRPAQMVIPVVSVVGLYLLCAHGGLSGFGLGEVLALLSALLMSAALLLGEKALSKVSAMTLTAMQALVSTVLAAISALLFEGGLHLSGAGITVWGIILYLAVTCTALGFLLQNYALRSISAKSVALLQCVCPVLTAVFSFLLLHEHLTPAGLIGSGIILACVAAEILTEKQTK